jgi:hypothetical protein
MGGDILRCISGKGKFFWVWWWSLKLLTEEWDKLLPEDWNMYIDSMPATISELVKKQGLMTH